MAQRLSYPSYHINENHTVNALFLFMQVLLVCEGHDQFYGSSDSSYGKVVGELRRWTTTMATNPINVVIIDIIAG